MKRSFVAGSVLVLCIGITALAGDEGGGFLSGMDAAQQAAGGGQLVYGRDETMGNTPIYGFYFWVDGRLLEIEVGGGGDVIKNKEVKDITDKGPVSKKLIDALKVRTKTKLPNARYIEIALEKTKGKDVKSFSLAVVGDDIHVQVRTDNGSTTLNMTDGQPVK